MGVVAGALLAVLAIQAAALAARAPGLHVLPRNLPRASALVPALLSLGALAWAVWHGQPAQAAVGFLAGAGLALALPALRPLHPDERLLEKAQALELVGHGDAHAVLLRPAGTSRGVVLLCHGGGNDRSFALWHLVPRLLEKGFAVVLAHLAGHGRGGSDLLSLETFRSRFDALLEATRKSVDGPTLLVGQSLGGALALDALARGTRVDGAVTVSAIVELDLGLGLLRELGMLGHAPAWNAVRHATLRELAPAAGPFGRERFPVRVAPGERYLDVFARILRELDLPRRLAQTRPGCPLLVIQGRDDGIVPVSQGRALATALAGRATYVELPGRHHLDPLFDDRVVEQVVEFVDGAASGLLRAPAPP